MRACFNLDGFIEIKSRLKGDISKIF